MKYITKYIYLLIIINLIFSSNVWDNKLLFCLKKNIDPLKIIDKKNITNNELLNNIINKYNILNIEPTDDLNIIKSSFRKLSLKYMSENP